MTRMNELESAPLQYIAYIVGIAVVSVNLFFACFAIKTFTKKPHNILILCLCFSDGLHGFASLLLTDSIFGFPKDKGEISKAGCITKLLLYFVSIGFSLCLLLFISIERYVTVKHCNFVSKETTPKSRYALVGSLIALLWLYVCIWILIAPVQKEPVLICSVRALYTDYVMGINGWAIICLYASLIVSNVLLYGKTTHLLWTLFKKPSLQSKKRHVDANDIQSKKRNSGLGENSDFSPKPSTSKDCVSPLPTRKVSLWKVAKMRLQHRPTFPQVYFEEDQSQLGSSNFVGRVKRNAFQMSLGLNRRMRRVSRLSDPWERKAMLTNLFLIFDHVMFFLPMVCLSVADRSGARMPREVWIFGSLWLMFHFLINPFVFAWRVVEINTEVKKVFKCTRSRVFPAIEQHKSKK